MTVKSSLSVGRCAFAFAFLGRYLGDQRFSYGLDLTFTLRVGEERARASVDDVVIEGDGRRISAPIFAQDNQVSHSDTAAKLLAL